VEHFFTVFFTELVVVLNLLWMRRPFEWPGIFNSREQCISPARTVKPGRGQFRSEAVTFPGAARFGKPLAAAACDFSTG
jgi:hypothetical protein